MSIDQMISGICNSRIGEVILIGNNTSLLNYKRQFMGVYMQQIVDHKPEHLSLIVIYIGYWSVVDSLQWDIESILEFDYKGANTPIGHSGPHSELIGQKIMVFTRSIMTLELSTSIRIDPGTFRSKVCDFILQIYVFYGIYINTCLSIVIDLESLGWICMHPT